jgi:formamidopyrimidine-DNA glycosylase
MPELPEVETTRRGLTPAMAGKAIRRLELRRADLRFPFQPDLRARVEGRTVERLDRRAKYLIVRLSGGDALVLHLGMSGSFRVESDAEGAGTLARLHREIPRLAQHDHVVMHMSGGVRVVYNDPRRFGFMFVATGEELNGHPRMREIGVEPLDPPIDAKALTELLGESSTSLKAALLDQKRIAGLGNIYVCEALHRAGLSPWRVASTLAARNAKARAAGARLSSAIVRVLEDAIVAGGSSLRDFSGADGKPGYFQHSFRVYDREGAACPRKGCCGTIARAVQNGRSTFYCPDCQT